MRYRGRGYGQQPKSGKALRRNPAPDMDRSHYWKVLTKLRCAPHRATALVQAILVLQLVEEGRYSG
ncbi:MAG: transposase, family [Nonomuraea muscovyensis]|nr:transposase, family [Nonomuraea muscovyensis]